MSRPQQSTIVQASSSHHCNSPRTYVPGEKIQSTKHLKLEVEVEVEDERYFNQTQKH